jgi:hypothetical protein
MKLATLNCTCVLSISLTTSLHDHVRLSVEQSSFVFTCLQVHKYWLLAG